MGIYRNKQGIIIFTNIPTVVVQSRVRTIFFFFTETPLGQFSKFDSENFTALGDYIVLTNELRVDFIFKQKQVNYVRHM